MRLQSKIGSFRGGHLSPLGFAACQSKKCNNRARSATTEQVGALETSAPPESSICENLCNPWKNTQQIEIIIKKQNRNMILDIDNILVSSDIITEQFCCDLDACKGICCVEGDAGAPVTLEEIGGIEDALDTVWGDMSAQAQAVVDKQGVAYTDRDGDLVTSIVGGKDCVFTCYEGDCCLCALERAYRAGKTNFIKPISCALYPIREKRFANGTVALNYNRWDVCKDAVKKGRELGLPVYKFLEGPLTRRFGKEWYAALCEVADHFDECNTSAT